MSATADDDALVEGINCHSGAESTVHGRAEFGKLGGAIFVEWPDGRPAVVTMFHGGLAGALADLPDVPPVARWFQLEGGDPAQILGLVNASDQRPRGIVEQIVQITSRTSSAELLTGDDLVHVDLSTANVLFDASDTATAVVDWNLGVYRGDRRLALVQTRFDREWFIQSPDAGAAEIAAAGHLDEVLADRIDPETLRVYWAFWLHHHLPKAFRSESATVIDWQLAMAESRLR